MTLADLAKRTSLSTRQLRYVLDHALLPAGRIESRGRGAVRVFTDFEAFAIACAAVMLQAGLRQVVVRDCIALLCRYEDNGLREINKVPLYRAFEPKRTATLEVGDGVNVRVLVSGSLPDHKFDTTWRQIATGAVLGDGYSPLIVISINLGLLSRLMGRSVL
jgi:hypothetical protein